MVLNGVIWTSTLTKCQGSKGDVMISMLWDPIDLKSRLPKTVIDILPEIGQNVAGKGNWVCTGYKVSNKNRTVSFQLRNTAHVSAVGDGKSTRNIVVSWEYLHSWTMHFPQKKERL